ncbi:hypothetical protein ACFLQN_03380 [Candidatus Aenigmatarchaeota archaeon]
MSEYTLSAAQFKLLRDVRGRGNTRLEMVYRNYSSETIGSMCRVKFLRMRDTGSNIEITDEGIEILERYGV